MLTVSNYAPFYSPCSHRASFIISSLVVEEHLPFPVCVIWVLSWPLRWKIYKYSGPKFVVFNKTATFMKGIDEQLANSYVPIQCKERNYKDKRLASLKVIYQGKPTIRPTEIEVRQAYLFTYVSCFPGQIKIGNKSYQSPPFPFTLDGSIRWSTEEWQQPGDDMIDAQEEQECGFRHAHPKRSCQVSWEPEASTLS